MTYNVFIGTLNPTHFTSLHFTSPLLIFPCTIKSRSSLLAPAHPGGPGERAIKRLWCGGGLLCPNGWMHQDTTRYGGRPRPGHIVLDGDPAPSPKGHSLFPIFGPCLLWPNGWMDQDATWYRDRPRPRLHCVRWGPAPSLLKGAQHPLF